MRKKEKNAHEKIFSVFSLKTAVFEKAFLSGF